MRGAVLYGAGDVRFEERPDPEIVEPTDAIISISATCVCGLDLWSYRRAHAVQPVAALQSEYSLWFREPERLMCSGRLSRPVCFPDASRAKPNLVLHEIDSAAAKIKVQGARYPEHLQKLVGR